MSTPPSLGFHSIPVCCFLVLLELLGNCPALSAGDLSAPTIRVDRDLAGIGLDGRKHQFGASSECHAVVVVFLATQCPISNGTLPAISKLAAKFKPKGIEFYGVISDPAVLRADAARHRDEYRISFPVLFDASLNLRRKLRPTHSPQAIVLSPMGDVLYSGRIDDRYADLGRKRDAAIQHDLENALTAIIAGQPVPVAQTKPVGCLLEEAPRASAVGTVTFNRDIAPLLLGSCVECHRPGESAPFSLLTYADVCAHARQIGVVTQSRQMPPWHPASDFGHFLHERRLADDDVALIQRWVAEGMPEGDPRDRPVPPHFLRGWRLGQPDLILKMPDRFELSADGPDVHQHFVLPTGLKQTRLVSAVEFRPGNSRVVHHASFYIDNKAAARKLDEQDPTIGYGSFAGPGFDNYSALRSWLPGMTPQRLPRGMGTPMPARSDIVLEIHYQRTGKIEFDQSTLGIFFAEPKAKDLVLELQVMNQALAIPAGDSQFRHVASYTLPVDATLLDAAPHMHKLGREMKATAMLPDGTQKPLVWIKNWDFNWQGQYLYVDPLRLPRGTRIEVETWYDNSADNPLNPNSPPQTVCWGEQTKDEMAICHFRYKCDSQIDLLVMSNDFRAYATAQHETRRRQAIR